jgi:hypothetical protein
MKRAYLPLAALICVAGCKSEPTVPVVPQKSIVQQVEDAGISPGDLSHADAAGLQLWLGKHSDVGKNIAAQCKDAMTTDSTWQHSEEGRICLGDKYAGYIN